jgi:hypothetical protein
MIPDAILFPRAQEQAAGPGDSMWSDAGSTDAGSTDAMALDERKTNRQDERVAKDGVEERAEAA